MGCPRGQGHPPDYKSHPPDYKSHLPELRVTAHFSISKRFQEVLGGQRFVQELKGWLRWGRDLMPPIILTSTTPSYSNLSKAPELAMQ